MERCDHLTSQVEGLAARAKEHAEAARVARLEAAAAKEAAREAAATSTMVVSQSSLCGATHPPPAAYAEAPPASAMEVDVAAEAAEGAQGGGGGEIGGAKGEGGGGKGMKVLHMRNNPTHNAQLALIDGLQARVRALRMQLDVAEAAGASGVTERGWRGALPLVLAQRRWQQPRRRRR